MNHMAQDLAPLPRDDAYFRLRGEIEEFFYEEADLIDGRHFEAWLGMLAEDLEYYMPIRRNVKFGQHAERENTPHGEGISWFDEDKWTLTKRVEQILTGVHYAEEPLSRTSHLVSNIRVLTADPSAADATEVTTSCRFHVHLNRVEYETHTFVGRRHDRLVKRDGAWKLRFREILLDQNVLLAKNLTTFF